METLPSAKENIELFRQEFLQELPSLARGYIDTARAEGTTAAFEKVMNTALKVIEGLEVDTKRDQYAHLPVINVIFGPGMQMATTVTPPVQTLPTSEQPDAIDVTPKQEWPFPTSAHAESLPDDPLELLPAPVHTPEEQEVLDALGAAAGAMVLD